MKTVYGGFIRGVCRSATTLAAVTATPANIPATDRPGSRRSLTNELVAQIKKELRTQRVVDVAKVHGLKPSVVRAIEDGLNYKEVKAAE